MHVRRLVLVALVGARRRASLARRRASLQQQQRAAAIARRAESHALIESAMPMVERNARSIAKRLPPQIDKDELLDAGYLALVQAAGKFDPERGIPLEAYARRAVRGAMWELVRRRNWREMSHYQIPEETIGHYRGDHRAASETQRAPLSEFVDDTGDPHVMLEEKLRRERAEAAMGCLDDRERLVVRKYYAGIELTEIGRSIGLSKGSASRIHLGALRKMQKYFALRGIKAA